MIYYTLGLTATFISSIGQIFLKISGTGNNNTWKEKFFNKYFLSGNIFFTISTFISIYVLSKLEFSSYYSLTAANYFFISILSRIILRESIDYKKIFGNGLIIAGIIIYNTL